MSFGHVEVDELAGDVTVVRPERFACRHMGDNLALDEAFLLALEQVDTAVRGTNPSEAVMRDDSGKTVITMTRLSPDQIGGE